MGRFNLGSTVIVLATDQMKIDEKMTAETEIKLGQCLLSPKEK
jgi:phosphatidylserine decarboxylase